MENMEEFKPFGARLIVKVDETKQEERGGIIIPDSSEKKALCGEVVVLGHGKLDSNNDIIPYEAKVGERIVFQEYSGEQFKYKRSTYLVLEEDEILGILEAVNG